MSMKRTDVIVVGAGPAGSWLGFRLAQAGIDSALFDREKFPRDKACGGGLSQKVIEFLPFSIGEVVEKHMTGAWIGYRNKYVLVSDIGPAGGMVMRDTFDDFLARKYVEAGGRFFAGASVDAIEETEDGFRIEAAGETWSGNILVGADGASSHVRRACGFGVHRKLLAALSAEMRTSEKVMQALDNRACFDLSALPGGYGWIFPKRDHLSIGVFTQHHGLDLRSYLQAFCNTHPLLRSGEVFRSRGGVLPVGGGPRPVQKGRVLLVGDAAATVEPFLGEGIYHALLSADIAANVIIKYLKHGRPLTTYADRIANMIDNNIARASRLASVFYGNLPWTFPLLVKNRIIARAFTRDIIGRSDFKACLRHCLVESPLIPFAYRRGISRASELPWWPRC
jgi:geranylgeranyl reductase family protein